MMPVQLQAYRADAETEGPSVDETPSDHEKISRFHYNSPPVHPEKIDLTGSDLAPLLYHYGLMIGESPVIKQFFTTLQKVCNNSITVLIQGESGTGKDLVARAIHYHSPRRKNPFVKTNSAALNSNLLESELFGHERGSFTGAHARKIGRFEAADGGTIFLDEIDSLDPALQAKLLRVIEHKEFERVGSNQTLRVDVKIITATNKDLKRLITEKQFRNDLYYRINTIPLRIPTLRERKEDIPLLVRHLVHRFNQELQMCVTELDGRVLDELTQYWWPGNIRELENVICQAMLNTEGSCIGLREIAPIPIFGINAGNAPHGEGWLQEIISHYWVTKHANIYQKVMEETERKLFRYSLLHNEWNIKKTCRALGISRNTLKERLRRYGLKRPG